MEYLSLLTTLEFIPKSNYPHMLTEIENFVSSLRNTIISLFSESYRIESLL